MIRDPIMDNTHVTPTMVLAILFFFTINGGATVMESGIVKLSPPSPTTKPSISPPTLEIESSTNNP